MDKRICRGVALKACVCMVLLLPLEAFADAQQQYSDFMSRYYNLDEQAFSDITCKIQVDSLQNTLAQTKQQLARFSGNLKIIDTLDQYQLVYSKSTGLQLDDPSMSIDIVSEKGMSDPARVRKGIGDVEEGFRTQVQGADKEIKGLFEGYGNGKKGDIVVEKVDLTADGATLEYKRQGFQVTDTVHGSEAHTVQATPDGNVVADASYKTVAGDKQILDKFDMKMDQSLQSFSAHSVVIYQLLDGVLFPQELDQQATLQSTQNMKMQITIAIKFTGCQLRK